MDAGSSTQARPTTDSLELEIFRHSLMAIAEEVEINITRTAYTYLIYECKDYHVGFLTHDFRLLGQSQGSIPIFVAGLGEPVQDAVKLIGEDDLGPGDVLVTNFTDVTGQHINNVIVAAPVFDELGIVAYLAIRSHWADVGGLQPGGMSVASRSVLHEGTRYRGVRVMRRGKLAHEVLATFQANSWQPDLLTGDLMAQLAACGLVARRWQDRIARRWEPEQVRELSESSLTSSAAFAKRSVAALPSGVYEAEREWLYEESGVTLDLRMKLKITVDGERMTVDLSEMPPETELPINSGRFGGGLSAVRVAFKMLLAPDFPVDDGFFEPLEVILPEGTILSASANAPMGHWNTTMPVVIDLFLYAIGRQHPELVPAPHFASIGGLYLFGKYPDGTMWHHADAELGGLGAHAGGDGFGPVKSLMLGDFPSVPVELLEARYPLLVRSNALDRSAGGAGRFRGGPGTDRVIEVLADVVYDPVPSPTEPARGLAGGGPGRLGGVTVMPVGTTEWQDPPRGTDARRLGRGSLIRHRGGGGGGWGPMTSDGDGAGTVTR